jgi:hypothetical protein
LVPGIKKKPRNRKGSVIKRVKIERYTGRESGRDIKGVGEREREWR